MIKRVDGVIWRALHDLNDRVRIGIVPIRFLALGHAPSHLPVIHSQTRLAWICGQAPTAAEGRVSTREATMRPACEKRHWLSKRDIARGSPYPYTHEQRLPSRAVSYPLMDRYPSE